VNGLLGAFCRFITVKRQSGGAKKSPFNKKRAQEGNFSEKDFKSFEKKD
jgi:hypothetical protein